MNYYSSVFWFLYGYLSETKDPTWSVTDSEIEEQEAYDQQISEEEKEDFDYTEIQAPGT